MLIKNDDALLPLSKNAKLAVIGYMATDMRYQGAGSSHINATRLSQPLDFLTHCEYTPAPAAKKGSYTMENTVLEMQCDSLVMKIMYKAVEAVLKKAAVQRTATTPN